MNSFLTVRSVVSSPVLGVSVFFSGALPQCLPLARHLPLQRFFFLFEPGDGAKRLPLLVVTRTRTGLGAAHCTSGLEVAV
ncbi:hypothetical protein NDU88_006060 [Pleurodeles waltl]|uniref:Secreted protein n=1 Tax=Pleurodeles waltl TaxID=8319 RepID=A0AAV7TCS7_PLEWA|nr:hypothetical protein NDU88_006060 [Pleurodeles waltl]